MTYRSSDHPRAPKGTPNGGQFTQKAGVGIDDDLLSISPYDQYSNEELKNILSDPETFTPEYDDMRTALYQRQNNIQSYRQVDIDTLLNDISVPDGGATYNPFTGQIPTSVGTSQI